MKRIDILVLCFAFAIVFGDDDCKSGLPKDVYQRSLDGKRYALFLSEDTDYEHADKRSFPIVFGDDDCKSGLPKDVYQRSLDGKCYALFLSEDTDYEHADKRCKDLGGFLAMPKTRPINDFLTGILEQNYKSRAWIGLQDREIENLFKWADGTMLDFSQGFHSFAQGNGPHGIFDKGILEDCVVLYPDGLWHDYRCKAYKLPFISIFKEDKHFLCEFDIVATTQPPTTPTPTASTQATVPNPTAASST